MTGTRRRPLLALLVTAALLGVMAVPALADPLKLTINPGGTRFREGHPHNHLPRGQAAPKFQGVLPGPPRHDGRHRHGRADRGHHGKRFRSPGVVVLPSPVVVVPRRCWTQGYWAYQWVPHTSAYQLWVPEHWSAEGTWVPGHYQTHYHASGYYQPYWVDGYWSGC